MNHNMKGVLVRSVNTVFFTAAAAALLVVPSFATAQAARTAPAVGVTAGILEFDLAGTGTRMFVGARAQIPLTPLLLLEPGATYMSYRERGLAQATRHHIWFPEAQIQAQMAMGALRPYLGIGAGVALESVEGQRFTEVTLSAALGARLPIAERLQLGAEVRLRGVDPFTGSTSEFGLSAGWRL